MKKLFFSLAISATLFSCGKSEVEDVKPSAPEFCYACYVQTDTKNGGGASDYTRVNYDFCNMTEAEAQAFVTKNSIPWHWEGYFQVKVSAKCTKK
jgi:hypothetical protein